MLRDAAVEGLWYVTNGVVAVGPVDYELLTRGVIAGRIPSGSYVRHESWKVWRRLEDIKLLSTNVRRQTVKHLGDLSATAEERASSPYNEAPQPPVEIKSAPANDSEPPMPSTVRPLPVDPIGVLKSAATFSDAVLLALSTLVTAAAADLGFVHRVRDDLGATVTTFAHGPGTELLLGERLATNDPSLAAARAGHTVVGEPRPGDAGRWIAERVRRCSALPRGVAMVPLLVNGQLALMFEIARYARPFRAREVARAEEVVTVLAERIVVEGWSH